MIIVSCLEINPTYFILSLFCVIANNCYIPYPITLCIIRLLSNKVDIVVNHNNHKSLFSNITDHFPLILWNSQTQNRQVTKAMTIKFVCLINSKHIGKKDKGDIYFFHWCHNLFLFLFHIFVMLISSMIFLTIW